MIKVKILTRMNLTMLGKAYMENLLPKGLKGEVFFDKDTQGEIDSLYFKNYDYFFSLLKFIEENKFNFYKSNAQTEWNNLFIALANYIEIDNVDFGKIEHYSLTKINYEEAEIDETILKNINPKEDSFLVAMKKLYKGYDVTYWGSENFVVVHTPLNPEVKFNFDLNPIYKLLLLYNKSLEAFNIYRDPLRNLTVVRINIE